MAISAKTFQRCWQVSNEENGQITPSQASKKKQTKLDREHIMKVANKVEFSHLPPYQIVPRRADTGIYIASESSFYHVLCAKLFLFFCNKFISCNI